jgi:hypothetical protein
MFIERNQNKHIESMEFFIDPDTGKTTFALDEIKMITEPQPVDQQYGFKVILYSGELHRLVFNDLETARRQYLEILAAMD